MCRSALTCCYILFFVSLTLQHITAIFLLKGVVNVFFKKIRQMCSFEIYSPNFFGRDTLLCQCLPHSMELETSILFSRVLPYHIQQDLIHIARTTIRKISSYHQSNIQVNKQEKPDNVLFSKMFDFISRLYSVRNKVFFLFKTH